MASFFIYYRNANGRLCSTIHSSPLTSINIPTSMVEEDGNTIIYKSVPCKFIDLSIYRK